MEVLESIFSMNMLMATIRMAVPLVLASIGGVLCERSGIINLGIEGMMLMGAFGAVVGAHFTGSAWLGVLFGIIVGGLFGLLHALLCIKFRTNQSVSGVGINIFASGLTIVLCRAIWDSDGSSGTVEQVPTMTIPLLNKIPVLGQLFENQSPFLYITAIIVAVSWYVMYKSNVGLRLRTIGDHPKAAATAGVNVTKYRYVCVILCGMLCGMAGAYLSIVQSNLFVKEMVAGRGFMAMAATIFGGWNPAGSLLASLLFAFAQALRINVEMALPQRILQMVPYLLTLVVLIGFGRRVQGPKAAGDIKD
ncbi:MAG: ABC transporter permease [Firmicutes bacterium]|jgi:simple sugar transport system permease protein|nr:ABC transporter permease [Bacillota bacterium]MBR5488538.1 ABC transporter permease [Bacillota bacterium]